MELLGKGRFSSGLMNIADNIIFAAGTVAPVFIIITAGYVSRRLKIINENFVDITSRFVFNVSLPVFIFLKLVDLDLSEAISASEVIYIYLATILSFFLLLLISSTLIKNGRDRASFLQGAFRGNFAIIGLAVVANLFGREALGDATVLLAFIIPLYNVLAVIALTIPLHKDKKINMKATIMEILLNPLVVSVIIGLPFSFFKIRLPGILLESGNYISDLALPMALVGIGGSLNLKSIRKASKLAFFSSAVKLVILPAFLSAGAYVAGFRGEELGIMFILFACPTAIVSFIMAETMGANSKLAGNIVLVSTMGSIFTLSAGIMVLRGLSLI